MRFYIILISGYLLSFSSAGAQWRSMTDMPTARYGAAAAVLDEYIYVIGGMTAENEPLTTVERYDMISDEWDTEVDTLTFARWNAVAASYRGSIYIFGGFGGLEYNPAYETVEVYDPDLNEWETAGGSDVYSSFREGSACLVLDDWIYFIGGLVGSGGSPDSTAPSPLVDRYSPDTEMWESQPQLNFARKSASAVVYDDTIYVMGGFEFGPLGIVEKYTPDNEAWEILAVQITPRGYLGAGIIDNLIFAIGGSNLEGELDLVESFTDDSEDCYFTDPLNEARDGLNVVSAWNGIFAIGGRRTVPSPIALATVEIYEIATGNIIERDDIANLQTLMDQNYPNPFINSTNIPLQVPANNQSVKLSIYNISGQLIWQNFSPIPLNTYSVIQWDTRNCSGEKTASGTYFYQLKTDSENITRKLIIIR